MGIKKRIKALRIARDCWAGINTAETREQCKVMGCPYADAVTDCAADALMDAVAVAEILWRERKEKGRVERGEGNG